MQAPGPAARRMVVPMELAAAARRKLLRAARRGRRVGPGDLEGHRRRRSLIGRRFPSSGPDPGRVRPGRRLCACIRISPPDRKRILRNRAGSRAERPDSDHSDRIFEPGSPLSTKINMLWLRTQSNKPLTLTDYAALRLVRTNLRAAWEIELLESSLFTGQNRLDLIHWSWRAHRS